MKKILIAGGAGYIGGYMADVFAADGGYEVTVFDNLLYEARYLKDMRFIYGDIRDTETLKNILPDYDIVVWLAAIVGDGACGVDISYTKHINYVTAKWLADNYKGKIIYASTCSVYGDNDDILDENSPVKPLSLYASTKLEAEEYILQNNADALIFRLGTLYGLGDSYTRLRFDLVANILTLKAVRGEPLCVFGGEQWRPLLHVRDVGHAAKHFVDNGLSGLYVLSERNMKIHELGEIICERVPGSKVEYQSMKYEDLRNYRVDNSKALATGWRPKLALREGIDEIAKVVREGRVKNVKDPVYSNIAFLQMMRTEGYFSNEC